MIVHIERMEPPVLGYRVCPTEAILLPSTATAPTFDGDDEVIGHLVDMLNVPTVVSPAVAGNSLPLSDPFLSQGCNVKIFLRLSTVHRLFFEDSTQWSSIHSSSTKDSFEVRLSCTKPLTLIRAINFTTSSLLLLLLLVSH